MRRARPVFEHLRRAATAYAVLLVALILTLLAYYYVSQNVEAAARNRFDETVRAAGDALDRQMNSYVDAMLGARALFYASTSVEREEWEGYASGIGLQDRYEGMQVLGYARRVESAGKDEFVEELSQTFDETELPEPALRPEGERSDYFPITFVEPLDEANRSLIGYDAYSNPEHRAAMDRARDTGDPQATSKDYVLIEASEGSRADLALEEGFVVYLPIYREGEPADTADERQRALAGFVVGSLAAEGLLRGTFRETFDPSVDFEVYDGERLTSQNLLYDDDGVLRAAETQTPPEDVGSSAGPIEEVTGSPIRELGGASAFFDFDQLYVAGREYGLYFEALPEFEDGGSWLPLFVLLSGMAVSLLLFGITWMLSRSRLLAEESGRELQVANHELEAANRELEAFSYSVSHDLRAPLRSIDGFSQILLEDHADELDEEGKDYLGRVRAASQRMGNLIDDLLGLSQVTRSALRREDVDLSQMAREVAAELRRREPGRRAEVEVEEGLVANGDPRLLRVALENLIGNAWKFTGKEEEARIRFGLDKRLSGESGVTVFRVSDNGAGFEMAYAGKLFGAFQRLHGAEEFEGTGIGLATVQRVVRRHGGRVWAEGEVGEGASFFFTLSPGLSPESDAPREENGKK